MKKETEELRIKLIKIKNFMVSDKFELLSDEQKDLCLRQKQCINNYYNCLLDIQDNLYQKKVDKDLLNSYY